MKLRTANLCGVSFIVLSWEHNMLKKIAVLTVILCAVTGNTFAQVGKTEDMRVRPPETWQKHEKYGLDLSLGSGYLNGNVDNFSISGGLDFDWKAAQKHTFYIQAMDNYVKYNGTVVADKAKGSALYAYAAKPKLNFFLQTTHARNKFMEISYRTSNTAGICLHHFVEGTFSPILISAGLTPEYEKRTNGTVTRELRSTERLNFVSELASQLKFSGDFIYMPKISKMADYRTYCEIFLELKVWKDTLAFRVTASNEYDSKPYPNVKKNDFSLAQALVVRFSR
ncbi:MAG TPA: hypothetical protein DCL44_01950 [Elusimicrobia bacterium]|nr:hypothetical protein [Elusimicrobiota bacterium]